MQETPKFCKYCGAALGPQTRFCPGCGQPARRIPAVRGPGNAPPPVPPGPTAPQAYFPPPDQRIPRVQPPPRRANRSSWGCCLSCLGVVVGLAAIVAVLVFLWVNRPSDNLALGSNEKVKVVSAPGKITVQDPASAINGLSINIPEGAYEKQPTFKITTRPIQGHKFGPDFDPVTALIHVDNGGAFAADGMTVEVPISISQDEFAMAFYYDEKSGKLEGIPLLDLTTEKATLLTAHFSDFVITKIPYSELLNTDVDTGFTPGADDWQFVNEGSFIAQAGHCAGQSMTAMWYYEQIYQVKGERRLYGRYDNNNYGVATIDFQDDDSWGYRWSSVIQNEFWDKGQAVYRMFGIVSSRLTWYSFAYAMRLTGEPQYVAIAYYSEKDGKPVRNGHAIVAYKIEGTRLWVSDPNFPGDASRYIEFNSGDFQAYSSGQNARDIKVEGVKAYREFAYLAKTALVDWNRIGAEYEKLLAGKAGDGYFPPEVISYLADFNATTAQATWITMPDTLELEEADTAKPGPGYSGKIFIGINLSPDRDFQVRFFNGTQEIEAKRKNGARGAEFTIPLDVGVNDIGFLVQIIKDNEVYYNDFRRYKVIYEMPDLSGTWEGTFQIEQAGNAMRYVEDAVVWALVNFGVAKSESEARELTASILEESPNLRTERPMTIVLTALDPEKLDRYSAEVYQISDAGEQVMYKGEATVKLGVVTLITEPASDGSNFIFTAALSGKDNLSGEFSVTGWRIVKDALTGSWNLARQK